MFTQFCVGAGAGDVDFPRDLGPVDFENGLALAEYWLPEFLSLLEDVFEGGVLIRLLLSVAVAGLVLRVT